MRRPEVLTSGGGGGGGSPAVRSAGTTNQAMAYSATFSTPLGAVGAAMAYAANLGTSIGTADHAFGFGRVAGSAAISMGSIGHAMAYVASLSGISLGSEGAALSYGSSSLTTPAGTEGTSMAYGSARVTTPAGTEGASMTYKAQATTTYGSEGASMAVTATASTKAESTVASVVDIGPAGGDAVWTTPDNAKVEDTSSLATITLTGNLTAAKAYSSELRLASYGIGATPAGYTMNTANLRINHRWTVTRGTGDLTSTVLHEVRVLYTDATEDIVFSKIQGGGDQGTLLITNVDVANRVITQGKTISRVMFQATCSIPAAATLTTYSWNVDAARFEFTYTRASFT